MSSTATVALVSDIRARLAKTGRPMVIAHRGVCSKAPENSLAAIEAARAYDMVEIDLRLSADNVPIVMHDETLARTTGRLEKVSALTADERQNVPLLNSAECVSTLQTALDAGGTDLLFDLDVKNEKELNAVADYMQGSTALKRCMLKMTVARASDIDPLLELDARYGMAVIAKVKLRGTEHLDLIESLSARDVAGAELWFSSVELLRAAVAFGLPLTSYTLNDVHCAGLSHAAALCDPEGVWGVLRDVGLKGIITDEPAALAAFLESNATIE